MSVYYVVRTICDTILGFNVGENAFNIILITAVTSLTQVKNDITFNFSEFKGATPSPCGPPTSWDRSVKRVHVCALRFTLPHFKD